MPPAQGQPACIGKRRQADQIAAVVVLRIGLAVARHECHFEHGLAGSARRAGLVRGTQAAVEDLAQHIHPGHGGPVQEIAAPETGGGRGCAGAVIPLRARRISVDRFPVGQFVRNEIAALRAVAVALRGIEVAVVLEMGQEEIIDAAVEVQVFVVGVRAAEHAVVLGHVQHHHREVGVRIHIGRNRLDLGIGSGGAHQCQHRNQLRDR